MKRSDRRDLVQATADVTGVKASALVSKHFVRRIAWPRQTGMLAGHKLGFGDGDIALAFGGRDRSTISYGIRSFNRIKEMRKNRPPSVQYAPTRAIDIDWREVERRKALHANRW